MSGRSYTFVTLKRFLSTTDLFLQLAILKVDAIFPNGAQANGFENIMIEINIVKLATLALKNVDGVVA